MGSNNSSARKSLTQTQLNEQLLNVTRNEQNATITALTATVIALIAAGANVNVADQRGKTPLMWAAQNGYTGVVSTLIAAGANVNAVTLLVRNTALILSAFHGHTDTVSALIAAGANVNAASLKGGNTALMGAALSGHTAVISLLISAHANVNAVNQSGYTALKLASENNHHNATLTLLSAMPFQKVESTSAAQLMTPSIPAATFLPIAQQMTSLTIHISDNSVTATEEQKEKKNFKHPYQIK